MDEERAAGDEVDPGDEQPFQTVRPKQPWWVATRSLGLAIVLGLIWLGFFVYRVTEVHDAQSVSSVVLLVMSGVLVMGYGIAAIYHVRVLLDRRRSIE